MNDSRSMPRFLSGLLPLVLAAGLLAGGCIPAPLHTPLPWPTSPTGPGTEDARSVGSLAEAEMDSRVSIEGELTEAIRLSNGSIRLQVRDETGTIQVFADDSLEPDLLGFAVGGRVRAAGRLQRYRGILEVFCLAPGDCVPVGLPPFEAVRVEEVVDGDTIRIRTSGGQVVPVRLIGIDTPERGREGSAGEPFAEEATARLEALLREGTVYLERENAETDAYGRLLRHAWLSRPDRIDAEAATRWNTGAILAAEGLAEAIAVGTDVKYFGLFRALETAAREGKAGMWGDGSDAASGNASGTG